jgi:hypothetical protein
LFLVPGLVLLALLAREERSVLAFDEALYLAVGTSVTLSAWIALVLAEAGCFSLVRAALILGAASATALALFWRRASWPLPSLGRIRDLVPAGLVLAVALFLQARPTEYLLGGRDPGTYVASMALIARTGGISYTDPLVLAIPKEDVELFYRNPDAPDFNWGRFMGFPLERPETGRVIPEFFHLFPAFGAYLFQAMGVKGALATPPIFGILGTLGVLFALRRIFGAASALLGTLLLSLNVVQVWFARFPVSEPVSQFLIFLGLLAFAHWEERGGALFGALAGFAFGASLLVRIDSVLLLVPLGLYLMIRSAHRDLSWSRVASVLVPFALLAAHAALHALFWARKYLLSITERPYWHQPPQVWIGLLTLVGAAIFAAHRLGPLVVARLAARAGLVRAAVIALVVVLSLYAYFLRPYLSAWAGGDGNPRAMALANPGVLHLLGFQRLAAHDAQAFVRLGWFVTPLGLLLSVLGLILAVRESRPRALFFLLLVLTFAAFYFYKIRVWNDYFFALRRYVPVVLPALMAFVALLLVHWARAGGLRRALAATLALGLGASYAIRTWAIHDYTDWKGSVAFVSDVARRFGPRDVVIFEQRASIHLLSLPLWAVHGVNVLELARFNPDPDRLRHLLESWRGRFDNVYFVKTYRTDLCGIFLQGVEDYSFGTYEWARTLQGPPLKKEPRALRFTLSRAVPPESMPVPPLAELDVGGSDDFQVSGFFDKEGGEDLTYRWTGACASLYLPGARPGATITLRTAVGRRPTTPTVRVSFSGVALGSFISQADWTEASFTLPDPLPEGPPLLRLDVPAFRPNNVDPRDSDTRDLGVMVDRVQLTPPRAAGLR